MNSLPILSFQMKHFLGLIVVALCLISPSIQRALSITDLKGKEFLYDGKISEGVFNLAQSSKTRSYLITRFQPSVEPIVI